MKWIAGFLFVLTMAGGVFAQGIPRPQKIEDLITLRQDPDVPSWLERSPAVAPQTTAPSDDGLASWETSTRNRLDSVLHAVPGIPAEIRTAAMRTRQQALSAWPICLSLRFFLLWSSSGSSPNNSSLDLELEAG